MIYKVHFIKYSIVIILLSFNSCNKKEILKMQCFKYENQINLSNQTITISKINDSAFSLNFKKNIKYILENKHLIISRFIRFNNINNFDNKDIINLISNFIGELICFAKKHFFLNIINCHIYGLHQLIIKVLLVRLI
ncbi:MAG: hypothetical protein GY830_00790 [Bacteroidetes bacterium]|nr:hypothetical protein [Bacteroidota bacterium]